MLHDRIRRARLLRAMSLQQVADALGDISKQALSKYEKGKESPNSTRLIQIAEALGVEPEYFFRQDSVELGEVDFRKHSSFGKRQQEAVKEQVREHLERYFSAENFFDSQDLSSDFSKLLYRYPVHSGKEIEAAAEALRKEWDLGSNPIGNLTEILEENGVKVIALEAHDKFDGLCAVVNGGSDAVIVSNSERPGERQRFNLAHELGHLVMEIPSNLHGTKEEENYCHRFAGAFLFPQEQVKETFGDSRRRVLLNEFLLAKQEWGVSIQAILRRLYDLVIVRQSFYQATSKSWSIRGFRKDEPKPIPPEALYRLKQLVYRALAEGLATPSRAAELLGSSLREVEDILANKHPEDVNAPEDSGL